MAAFAQRVADVVGAIRDKMNAMNAALRPAVITVVLDGAGAAIPAGMKVDVQLPFACTIQGWTMLADQVGSIQIDLWRTSYANSPPNVGNTITASAKPALANALKGQGTALTGWSLALSAGDVIRFNVDSATTLQRVTFALRLQRVE